MGLQSKRQNDIEKSFDDFIELPKQDDDLKNNFLGKKNTNNSLPEEK